jgi:CRISPR-associated protein Csb3
VNTITINQPPNSLLSHMALYGLANICEDSGLDDIRLSWTEGMEPRPAIHTTAEPEAVAQIMIDHAFAHSSSRSWPGQNVPHDGRRALMSPRLGKFGSAEAWSAVQNERHRVLDELTLPNTRRPLDLRMIGAIGEPCYWRVYGQGPSKGEPRQDDGASRLEMQPRNQGSEFIGSRLRKASEQAAARSPMNVLEALAGSSLHDGAGNNKPDSRSAAGLQPPGPVDDIVSWCALWGFASAPTIYRLDTRAQTSICVRIGRREYFYVPLWHGRWLPARLRTVLVSRQLTEAARSRIDPKSASTRSHEDTLWLLDRGVAALVIFPVEVHGSASAPERRAALGSVHRLSEALAGRSSQ